MSFVIARDDWTEGRLRVMYLTDDDKWAQTLIHAKSMDRVSVFVEQKKFQHGPHVTYVVDRDKFNLYMAEWKDSYMQYVDEGHPRLNAASLASSRCAHIDYVVREE